MAELLDLPNELLCNIAGFVHFEDLEYFAETCKRMYSVSRPRVLEIQPLMVSEHFNYRNFRAKGIARLFIRVFQIRVISRYISELEIHSITALHSRLDCKYTDKQLSILNKAAAGLKVLGHPCPMQDTQDIIEIGNEDILLALLVPLLPNLRNLSIPKLEAPTSFFGSMLAASGSGNGTVQPLSKLKGLSLLPGQDGGFPLDQVALYLTLPSIKTLSVIKLCLEPSAPESLPWLSLAETITSLEFLLCKITSQDLHGFLLLFLQLQSFAYSCGLPLNQTN